MKRYNSRKNIPYNFDEWLKDISEGKIGDGDSLFIEFKEMISDYIEGINEDDFLFELYEECLAEYEELEFPLTIYRAIDLGNIKSVEDISKLDIDKSLKGMGVYWAKSERTVRAYWGRGKNIFILRTEVEETDVNWEETIYVNMNFSVGGRDDEDEIRLRKGVRLRVNIKGPSDKKWFSLRGFEVRASNGKIK